MVHAIEDWPGDHLSVDGLERAWHRRLQSERSVGPIPVVVAHGLLPFAFAAPYAASKHAVVGISFSMYQELATLGSHVHVSVLCPGLVRTRIADCTRNWPDRLGSVPPARTDQMSQMFDTMLRSLIEGGMEPADVAQQVFSAVQEERFWVRPNAESLGPLIKEVAASAVEGRTPPMAQLT